MSVYRKDDNGNIKKIAGSLTQRINMHIFQTTHEFDTEKNEDNYIINESDAKPYISSIKDWTQYSINLSEPNESSNINIKLGSQTLKLINNVKNIEIGTLNGVIQCHTEKLDNNEIFLDVVGTVVSLNGVEKTAINTDLTPTANSENLITSGGVHDYPAIAFAESERQKSKNLFKPNFWNKSSNIYQENGITFTYNSDDYSITINGTATDRALCYLNPDALSNIKIGTYTFSGFSKKTDYSVYIQAFNEADGKYPALLYSDSDFRTVTFNIMPNFTDLYISVDTGIVVDNLVLKFQAEEGNVATDYQPYYGQITHNGDPAITFAESERQKSKNLLEVNNGLNATNFGLHIQINNNIITVDGTLTNTTAINVTTFNPKIYAGKTYTLSFKDYSNLSGFAITVTGTRNDGTQRFNMLNLTPVITSTTITADVDYELKIEVYASVNDTASGTFKLQLEEGSVATDYQPYHGQITHNGDPAVEFAEKEYQKSKNLIPYPYHDGNSIVSNGITFTVNNDQSILVSGTVIDHNSNAVMWLAWDMPLKAGTYRISDSNPSNDLNVVAWIGNDYYQKDVNNGMFTLSSDTTAKIYIQVAKGSTKTYNDTIKFMLCEGTDTDWQPYNGEIIHEKEFHETLQNTPAITFAESERQKSKNLCGLIDFEQTVNGVTIKLVSSSQTIILNGTVTSTFDAMTTVRNMLPYVSNMQGEDLKVSAYYLSGTKSDTAIAFISTVDNDNVFGDRSAGISLPDSGITSINFSPSKNSTYNTLMLYTVNGASFTNYMFRIQIEKGQVTDWEYPHGPISHNKELDDVAVSNSAFDLSVANANSYQSVYDLLRVNKGVGNFYFAGNNFPSFLPPCPDDVWHGTGNIDQIVVKIDTNNLTKSLSMTLQGVNQNTPAYKLDAYFDGTNWRNSGWYKHRPMDLIYDMSSSDPNINRGFSTGVKFDDSNEMTNVINTDTTVYDYFIVTCKSRSNFYTGICNKPYPTIVGSNLYLGNSIVANNLLVSNTYIRPIDCYEWTSSWTNHKNDDNFVVTKIIGVK